MRKTMLYVFGLAMLPILTFSASSASFTNASEFFVEHQRSILDLKAVSNSSPRSVLGLRLYEADLSSLSSIASQFTNIVLIRLETSNSVSRTSEFVSLLAFKKLRFLQLFSAKSESLGDALQCLTNLSNLESLQLRMTSLTNMTDDLYRLRSVKALQAELGAACLPFGISVMTNLSSLGLVFRHGGCLPKDISQTRLKSLALDGGFNIDENLSLLPKDLIDLSCVNSNLRDVPSPWLMHTNLQRLNLNGNQITEMPSNLGNLSSLRMLSIENNKIRRIPLLKLSKNQPQEIWVSFNPIDSVDSGNNQLIQDGILKIK